MLLFKSIIYHIYLFELTILYINNYKFNLTFYILRQDLNYNLICYFNINNVIYI